MIQPYAGINQNEKIHQDTKMNRFYVLLCMLLLSAEANSNKFPSLRRTRAVAQTDVVSLTFCESNLPVEDKMGKKTLEEVHTYAELKNDPRASLPDSFTVCSTIMIMEQIVNASGRDPRGSFFSSA